MKPKAPVDLWAQLDAVEAKTFGAETADCPPWAFTVEDYCAHHGGMNAFTARSRLGRLVRAGALQAGLRPGHRTDGKRILLRVYWPAE